MNTDDTKFFILKAEWFWTRIAEGNRIGIVFTAVKYANVNIVFLL